VATGDDLGELIAAAAPGDLGAGDVLAVAHKVVSKAEGRVRALASVEPGDEAHAIAERQGKDPRVVQAVLDEAVAIVREGPGVLVCETRHGFVCANAGVDRSNTAGDDEVVLLPEDPDGSARALRARIAELRGVGPAVLVTDSFGRAWRVGQTDTAIGAAGLRVLDDWAGRADAGGRDLSATAIAVADAAAAAADLARAKNSAQPVVLLRGLERFVTDQDGPGAAALRRARADDLFR
jgi:coenzyme F420-0:L-glutamate ligase/coenzyme F420-1:gamma-L-glutamate ligase